MNEPSLSINPAEIENNSGRERFGFGLLPQPGAGCAIIAQLGLRGFGAETLDQLAQQYGAALSKEFLALHRRRLKKQRLLSLVDEEGLGEGSFDYWVFYNPALAAGCVLGIAMEPASDDGLEVTLHSERWFQSPTLAAAQELVFGLWERDFIEVQAPAFGFRKLQPGALPLERLRRNWKALFDKDECRANLGVDEITFEALWEECLQDS